jgi:hypothetical protein
MGDDDMSAFHALDAARAAGVTVRLNGKNLVLSGASAPPPDILDMLRQHKLSIVALLQRPLVPRPSLQPSQPWDRDDWRAFSDEQVRIYERNGLSRPAAEARAYDSCVAQWLCFKLVITQPGPCPICGDLDRPNDPLKPIGIIGGQYWLHDGCVKAWFIARRAEAMADLAAMGIEPRPVAG